MLIRRIACSTKDNVNHDTPQGSGLVPLESQSPRRSTTPSLYRIRPRRRKRVPAALVTVLSLLLLVVTTSALGPTKWLQSRLKRIAAAHLTIEAAAPPIVDDSGRLDTKTTTTTETPLAQESSPSPLLVVATHEGQVWTIDSNDGSIIAGFSTGPPLLVIDDLYDAEEGEEIGGQITSPHRSQMVPGMDGMIYWRQPAGSEDDEDLQPKLVPIASIKELVDNPIQICPGQEQNNKDCDILTAASLGPSLFSLNSQGSLNWARARHTQETTKPVPMQRNTDDDTEDEDDDDSSSSRGEDDDSSRTTTTSSGDKSSLLLQRQDYLVQQISTSSGEEIWNMTWGNLERIDFIGDDNDNDRNQRRDNDDRFHFLPSDEPAVSNLPSVVFGNQGKSIVAVMTQPPKFLWKRDFISVVTGVFGIENNAWQAVNVVAENDADGRVPAGARRKKMYPELPSHAPTGNSDSSSEAEEEEQWVWFWAGGASGLGKKPMEEYLIHGQHQQQQHKDAGLIFMPRPAAHNLVRNSWYLNHLWNSPQAMGAQSFHGYISDHSQKEEEERQGQSAATKGQHPYHFPPRHFYDTSSMPRLMLLPHGEIPPPNDTARTGGLFLSWSVVVAIISLVVGTIGVAYILYGQKKRKWLATSNTLFSQQTANVSTRSQSFPEDITSATMSLSLISGGQSKERSQSRSQDDALRCSDSNLGTQISKLSLGNPVKPFLNRSSSAPIIVGDHAPSFSGKINPGLVSNSNHKKEESTDTRQLPMPVEKREEEKEPSVPKPSQLERYQTAPAVAALLPQGGVGMIDGIPLIRYSRYKTEFQEIEPLGRGGFGTVFRVENVLDGREYAVKKVSIRSSDWNSPGTEAFSQELHRVLREVKFLALLDHPSIVRYYTAWLEMEEKDGNTGADENSNTLSRNYSSELLTSLDPTNGLRSDTKTSKTPSLLGRKKPSSSSSRAAVSHLKSKNATNPLGWNNFGNFEESSASAFYPRHTMPVLPPTDEDCGFIFEERSDEEEEEDPSFGGNHRHHSWGRSDASHSEDSKSDFSNSISSSWDASYSTNRRQKNASMGNKTTTTNEEEKKASPEPRERSNSKSSRHTLYIQMQLCSSKTLGDFVADKEARQGQTSGGSDSVDIPRALRLFLQIVQAVHHVHKQNLIHRDLKPSNCFIDETGTVKVGDFGLSRESTDSNDSNSASLLLDDHCDGAGDNTVGVGTRSYASPEQMNGSDYDSKTDIYALGVMLFELLYPMYTGMERQICLQKLRATGTFPEGWYSTVSGPFPTLNELVQSMLSLNPKHRPTADKVARHIQSLLEEHSVSLNINLHDGESDNVNVMFVRVEAKPLPDILKTAIELIHKAAAPHAVDVVQYGMRSSTKSSSVSGQKGGERAILEFALSCADIEPNDLSAWASIVASKLEESDEVLVARHVWHQSQQMF